jgi:putative ABC transport system permease protein
MDTLDISVTSLILAFVLLIVPLVINKIYALGLFKTLANSVARMSIQLFLVGIFLKYLFALNNAVINILWLAIMTFIAVYSVLRNSSMRSSKIFLSIFVSFSFSTFIIVIYLNSIVVRLDYIFDARYLIVLGGMLLGNSLRGNIVGINSFYQNIKKDKKTFHYTLSLGASLHEALLPYLRESVRLALKPTLASMATMGIVALPGMMTGVILGGTSPSVAVKYQIMIMIAILAGTTLSIILTILMTLRICFTKYGTLRNDIFAEAKSN